MRRTVAAISSVALAMGTLGMADSAQATQAPGLATSLAVQAVESSTSVEAWGADQANGEGQATVSLPDIDGDWAEVYSSSVGSYGAPSVLVKTAGGGLAALPGSHGAVASIPPAVAAGPVLSASLLQSNKVWAVTGDGTVYKWGETRGVGVFPNRSWTPAQLGGRAVASNGHFVLLADGRMVVLDSFDPDVPIPVKWTGTGDPLTGALRLLGGVQPQLADGTLVEVDSSGVASVYMAADPADPVVDSSNWYVVTASGAIYKRSAAGPELVTNRPDDMRGKPVRAVEIRSGGSDAVVVLTDTGDLVMWNTINGSPVQVRYSQIPATVNNGTINALLEAPDRTVMVWMGEPAPELPALAVTAQPTISGTAKVNRTLTATPATFNAANATVAHQWFANGDEIAGATNATLVLTEAQLGKTITYVSTGTRPDDAAVLASDPSNAVGPVAAADPSLPALTVVTQPTISGTPRVGNVLTATPATFSDSSAVVSHQWSTGAGPIAGATGTSLTLTAAQVGQSITYVSKATRAADEAVTSSNASNALGPVPTPDPVKTVPAVSVSASAGTYGKAATVSVAVSSSATGNVTLTLDGVPAGTAAVSGGAATFSIPAATAAGSHALAASYAGNATHTAASAAGTLTIAKGTAKKPTFKVNKASTSKKKGKATVTVATNGGLAKATGKVTVTLKSGKTTKKITVKLSGGKGSISLPKLKKGTWKVTVAYNGDANYNKSTSKSFNVKIKK